MNVLDAGGATAASASATTASFCDACGQAKHQEKDLLKCGHCRQAFYHDQTCQKKHWPQHKARCHQLVRLQRQEQLQAQNVQVVMDHHKTNDDDHQNENENENENANKGRVVVALKDFYPGDVVLVESAALLFDTRLGYLGLLQAFGRASQETQQKVLNLHASPVALGLEQIMDDDDDDDALEARRQRYARLEQQRVVYLSSSLGHSDTTTTNQSSTVVPSLLTAETARKLLAIVETNAHEILFNVKTTNDIDQEPPPPQWMGLFCLSAMIEQHSCNPNLTINNNNSSSSTNGNHCCHEEEEGRLEFLADRFIAKGERLSTSYIEGIYEKSLQQRQALLRQEKHFNCSCDRFQRGLDECRPIIQLNESSDDDDDDNNNNKCCEHCHPVLFWHAGHEQFVCGVCTSFSTSMNNNDSMNVEFYRVENELVQCLHAVEQTMLLKSTTTTIQQGGGQNCFLVVLTQLASLMTGAKWKIYIHPLHWLNVSACQLLSQVASAAARIKQQQQPLQQLDPVSSSLLRLSALALLHNLVWVEQTVRILRQPTGGGTAALLREIVLAITMEKNCSNGNSIAPLPVQLMTILQSNLVNVIGSSWQRQQHQHHRISIPLDDLKRALSLIVSRSSSSSITTTTSDDSAGRSSSPPRPAVVLDQHYHDEISTVTADSLLTAFFAGQDLLRAGHADLCRLLYQHYQSWFHKLKQPNDENRARIDLFLASSQASSTNHSFANLV